VFATAAPASLLPLYQQLARLARAGGAPVPDAADSAPDRVDGRMRRHLRWFGGVAAVTDGASLFATYGRAAGRQWTRTFGRPALAVADGPFALAAIAHGVPAIAFVDLKAPAAGVAAHFGAEVGTEVIAVPVHVGAAPAAYEPVVDAIGAAFAAAVPAAVSHTTNASSRIVS
jgi:hypothetical protein